MGAGAEPEPEAAAAAAGTLTLVPSLLVGRVSATRAAYVEGWVNADARSSVRSTRTNNGREPRPAPPGPPAPPTARMRLNAP